MAERLAVERGRLLDDLGKRVVGMLVGVAGQARTSASISPTVASQRTTLGAARGVPCIDRERQLRGPQQQRRERREELVLSRIEQMDEPVQARDLHRRRHALGIERRAQVCEVRRRKAFALQPCQELCEETEVAAWALHGVHDAHDATAQGDAEHGLRCEHGDDRQRPAEPGTPCLQLR